MLRRGRLAILAAMGLALGAGPARALEFELLPSPQVPQSVIDAVAAAGRHWAALFSDPITLRIELDYRPLTPGRLAETTPQTERVDYDIVRSMLLADASSPDDASAAASLQGGAAFDLLLNRTPDHPTAPYMDADGDRNNTSIRTPTANLKALGRTYTSDLIDARIVLSSTASWSLSRIGGIAPGSFDLVGVAMHELGHALGFSSGVDMLDAYGELLLDSQWTYVTVMDLHRFSAESVAHGTGVIDFTADARDKYFSIDGGLTPLAPLATGAIHGDGRQASHWKGGLALGIMDPATPPGAMLTISPLDRRLFDVIGYDLRLGPGDLLVESGRTVVVEGPGAASAGLALIEPGATLRLAGEAGPTLLLEDVVILDAGRLDLGRGTLLLRTDDPDAMLERLEHWIAAARDGAADAWWGLGSGWVTLHLDWTVAAILNRDADGTPLHEHFAEMLAEADDILVQAAWLGDLNLDGRIDAWDFARLDAGLLLGQGGYGNGDLTRDGRIDGDDIFLMERAFLAWTTAKAAEGSASVPEPAGVLALAASALLLLRRRPAF